MDIKSGGREFYKFWSYLGSGFKKSRNNSYFSNLSMQVLLLLSLLFLLLLSILLLLLLLLLLLSFYLKLATYIAKYRNANSSQ